jgi:hypothetical protein
MNQEQATKVIKSLEKKAKEISSSKASAIRFLQEVGILDENGKFTGPYKELGKACIAPTQG